MRALLLDAGNTLVFLDMLAVTEIAATEGTVIDPRVLSRAEGTAKRRYARLLSEGGGHHDGWGLYMRTLLIAAGVAGAAADGLVPALRAGHDEFNLWRRVPDGLRVALERALEAGLRLGVISNSEGQLPRLFERVGLDGLFEDIVDSALEGISKPDPEIFRRALARMKLAPSDALYAGDIPEVDVAGAQAVGLAAALIDPLGFYPDHEASPRYRSVIELVNAVLEPGR